MAKKKKYVTSVDDIIKASDNEFVADIDLEKKKIFYKKDFYMAMNKLLEAGKSPVEAYQALGFDVKKLGEDRAYTAAKRTKEMAKAGKLNSVDSSSYDGSIPIEKMGELSLEEQIAYLKARNAWLESMVEYKKKLPSILEEIYMSSKMK